MRQTLRTLADGERASFSGSFARTGYKEVEDEYGVTHYEPTLMLSNLRDENARQVTDHQWFNYDATWLALGELKTGDLIQFTAEVQTYMKGRAGQHKQDYQLTAPEELVLRHKQGTAERIALPVDNADALIGYIMESNLRFYRATHRVIDTDYVDAWHAFKG